MADRPSTSRVGRPISRSAQQTPKSKAKAGRAMSKSAQKSKDKSSAKKNANPTREQLDQYYN